MNEALSALPPLVDLAAGSPVLVRVLVGMAGVVLLLWGARIYKPAVWLVSFSAGALGAVVLLGAGAEDLPVLADPVVVVVGALLTGAVVAGVAALVHKLGLIAMGGLGGVILAQTATQLVLAEAGPWWIGLIGGLLGALAMPLLFKRLLVLLTAAAGALCLAWSVGQPTHALLLAGLWVVGVLWQARHRRRRRGGEEDE